MGEAAPVNHGWVIVGAGIVMTCIDLGAMLGLSVFRAVSPTGSYPAWKRSRLAYQQGR